MSTNSIEHQFKQILEVDTSKEPIDLLKKKYHAITNEMWTGWYGGPFYEVWRARIGAHDSIPSLWYPPSDKISSLGRLNRRNTPLFYSCFGHNANLGSLEEIRANKGDYVTQIKCALVPESALLTVIGLGHIDTWMKSKAPQHIQEKIEHNQQERRLKFDSEKDFQKNEVIKSELDRMFKIEVPHDQSHLYSHSIAIAENVFENIQGTQGIIFPSIASNERAINLVLLPHIADKYYKVTYARIVEIMDKQDKAIQLRLLAESSTFGADGTIHWDFKSDKLKQEVVRAQ